MSRILNRKTLGVVLVALLVVTAGCSGLTGSNQADTGGDGEDEEADEDESGGDETTADDGGDSSADTTTESGGDTTATESPVGTPPTMGMGDYQFSEGESYTYSSDGDTSYDLTWEVTDVTGDQLSVEITSVFGDQEQTSTFEGTQSEVYQQLSQENSFAILFLSLRISTQIAEGRTLSTGNSWTIQAENYEIGSNAEWETASVEVTGTETYSGVQCSNVVVTPDNDQSSFATCVNPDYPFAIAIETTGDQSSVISLSDSSR
jgi:hypothetical protein